jgi:hypothetical protein
MCNFRTYAFRSGRLEERQIIQLIIIVIDHDISFHVWMLSEPQKNLLPARSLRKIRDNVDIANAPVARTKETRRIVTPIRDQNDFRASPRYHTQKDSKKPAVNNVGQFARIRRFLAIENAVDIEKYYFDDVLSAAQMSDIIRLLKPILG